MTKHKKPVPTADDYRYAKKTHERLVKMYGAGMTAQQVAVEMGKPTKSVSRMMHHYGFYVFDTTHDKRYNTEEVTALMTLRYHRLQERLKQIREYIQEDER